MTTIAVIGSGPAGCYCAQSLRKEMPEAQITVIDRMPVPFGLVRYGVAPDHQGTKTVTRQFERLFERQGVRFAGNVEIGRDVSLEQVRQAFDAVVLATGLPGDEVLGIPGDALPSVYGAGRVTRLINGHPDESWGELRFGPTVVLIGMGNVAFDVLRLLVKPLDAMEGSDLDEVTVERLRGHDGQAIRRIDVVSRSTAASSKFDPHLARELRGITGVRFEVEDTAALREPDGACDRRVEAVTELVEASEATGRTVVRLRFGLTPERIDEVGGVSTVTFRERDGNVVKIDGHAVVTAIGFVQGDSQDIDLGQWPEVEPCSGRLDPGLYRTGWLRRGPRGTIQGNRVDGRAVAALLLEDVRSGTVAVHGPGFTALPASVRSRATDYAGWKTLDAYEVAAAPGGRCRRKVSDRRAMMDLVSQTEHQVDARRGGGENQ